MDKWDFLLKRLEKSWAAVGKPDRILVAFSGGADSVCLLQGLHRLGAAAGMKIVAGHVDHGLRPESGADGKFVMEMCKALSIPCLVERVHPASSSEADAREARYAALYRMAEQMNCDTIAMAHHRKDQAETMLLHLFRGSGLTGLCAMAECRRMVQTGGGQLKIWRPLLECDPEELRKILRDDGIPWREDATNQDEGYLRNYIRHQLLPAINRRMPFAEQAMTRTAILMQEEEDFLSSRARDFLQKYACPSLPCVWVDYQTFAGLHPAMQRRVLRMVVPSALDFEQTERLRAGRPGDTINLSGNCRALITKKKLHIIPENPDMPTLGCIIVRPYQGNTGDGIRLQAMPKEIWKKCTLRFRKAGDCIHPLGGPGEKSLQDYWVDKKVDRPFRPYLPVLCIENRVIWSIGVGVGEEARIQQREECVLLEYDGYLPGEMPGSIMDIKELL